MLLPRDVEYGLLKWVVGTPRFTTHQREAPSTRALIERGARHVSACLGAYSLSSLRGQRILDFGCGNGWPTTWLAAEVPDAEVIGCDLRVELTQEALAYAQASGIQVRYVGSCKDLPSQSVNAVFSHDAFEHFDDPAAILQDWARVLQPGGRVFLKFGPLWRSPLGLHMRGTIAHRKVPWLHLVFREEVVMRLWSEMQGVSPPLERYNQRPGGLNKMTSDWFRQLVSHAPFDIESLRILPVRSIWGVPLFGTERVLTHLPVMRTLFEDGLWCVLRRRQSPS